MTTTTTTTAAVTRIKMDCENYKEAKAAALDYVFSHSGLIVEILGGNVLLVLDADYNTRAEIHYKGFKNE